MTLAKTAGSQWAAVSAALDDRRSLADACAGAGLDRTATARLTMASAGAWVELLDGLEGARVLFAEHRPGLAGMRVAAEAAALGFAENDEARAGFRRRWLGHQPAELMVGVEEQLAAEGAPWDVIIVDGLPTASGRGRSSSLEARFRRLATGLAPDGRLVVVADNWLSPFRAADRVVGRPTGPSAPPLRWITRAMRGAGLSVTQRFGLLRSSTDGVTAFDLDAPHTASAVLAASMVTNHHLRAGALRLLRLLAEHGTAAAVVPAWMVVFSPWPGASMPSRDRPTGRLGGRRSKESKVLRGEPPVELDKRYSPPEGAEREAMALQTLQACGLAIAPRLLGQPGPGRLRQSWEPGRPMRPADLSPDQLRTWIARAAEMLGVIQRATKRQDGAVLVHGDYWLGNLVVDDTEVLSVLDWPDAHWGEPTEDLDHLVESLVDWGFVSPDEVPPLIELARAARGTT